MISWLSNLTEGWRGARLSRVALGKYIVLFASALHIAWALLLLIDPATAGSTPVHVLVVVFAGPLRTAITLALVAGMAMAFPFTKYRISNRALASLLIPQQAILLMSAGAGFRAVLLGHYADGVARSWAFILGDQLPVILLALLYTVAVLEAAFES